MKNIDLLKGEIEEVRNGNDPCSTVKLFNKPNGILDSKLTNGHKVLEDRDAVMDECGEKLLSTDISREDEKKNKDGCHDSTNAPPDNQPKGSSSHCSNNGLSSGQGDLLNGGWRLVSKYAPKELGMSGMKESATESNLNVASEKNQSTSPSPKLHTPDITKFEEKKGQEFEPKTSNESDLNGKSEETKQELHVTDTMKVEEKKGQEFEPKTSNESDLNSKSEETKQELHVTDTKKVEEKKGQEFEPKSSNESDLNGKSEETQQELHISDTKKVEEESVQEVEPETSNASSKVIDEAPKKKSAKGDTNKVEDSLKLGEEEIIEPEKIDSNSASKIEVAGHKISLEAVSEPIESSVLKHGGFEDERTEASVDKIILKAVSETIENLISKVDETEETKIEAFEDKSSLEVVLEPNKEPIESMIYSDLSEDEDDLSKLVSETIEKAISKSDESKETKIESSDEKNQPKEASEPIEKPVETVTISDLSEEKESKEGTQAVGSILSVEESIEVENGSSRKSDQKEASSVTNSFSLEDELDEEAENALLQMDTSDKDDGENVDGIGEEETPVPKSDEIELKGNSEIELEKSDKMELKKNDETTIKSDEVDADDKTQIEGQPSKLTGIIASQTSINGSEDKSPEATVMEKSASMEVDDVQNCDDAELGEIGGSTEPAMKKDSERELQDRGKGSAAASEASDEIDTLQQPDKSSEHSDVPAELSPKEGPQAGQKRPAEFEEGCSKRLKTDDSSTEEEGSLKKRGSPSLEDIISESKRKKTELDEDNISKSNVISDSSEKSTNVDNSDSELEKSTKLDLDSGTDFDLDLELKSNSSESSVTDANEAKSRPIKKDQLLKKLLCSDSDDSNSANKESSSSDKSRNSVSGSASSLLIGDESSSTALIKETLRRLKKSDLEDLVMLKMSQNLTYKSEIGELRSKYQTAKEGMDRWMRRCHYFEKIEQELSITLKRYLDHIEMYKNEKGPEFLMTPMKFTRSVGLQVSGPLNHKHSRPSIIRSAHVPKTKQQEEHDQLLHQKYRQQQQVHELQQKKQQEMHDQQKQQQLKEQQQKALLEQESIQAVNSVKPAAPKVSTNVRSSTPRRVVASRPAAAAPTALAQELTTTRIVMANPTNQKSPPRVVTAVATAAAASSSTTAPVAGPVPVAITAAKMTRTPPAKNSLEVIDLTDKEDKSRAAPQESQKPAATASFTVVRQLVSKPGTPKLPMGTTVVSAAGRNNPVTLAANGTVVVKNGAVNNVPLVNIQRPVQAVRVTQSTTHPAPLPPCPPAIHQTGWLLAPPRPQLVVRKTPNGAGIMLSWTLALNKSYEDIASYQLYAYQESTAPPSSTLWKKVGDVKALPLPMACTLTQFVEGHKYHFAVRAVDIHSRVGHFSGPSTITLN